VSVRLPAAGGGTCRIAARGLTLTGGADRVSVRLPDRGYVAHVATPGPQSTTPVNATRAYGGTWGGNCSQRAAMVCGTCRIAAKRLTLTGGDRVGVRVPGTRGGQPLPDRGQAATSPTSRRRGHCGHKPASARERGTGARRDAGRECRQLTDRVQAATRCLTDFEA